MYKEIFKANQVDSYAKGWIVDLSPDGAVNPDCYWKFSTKAKATEFVDLLDQGYDADHASHIVNGE